MRCGEAVPIIAIILLGLLLPAWGSDSKTDEQAVQSTSMAQATASARAPTGTSALAPTNTPAPAATATEEAIAPTSSLPVAPVASPSDRTTPDATAETGEWKEYVNPDYAVSLRYPGNWQQTEDTRHEGQDGFFLISAIGSGYPLDGTCGVEANHTLKPYGSNPTIEYLSIQGADGCLILPSSDAPVSQKSLSALILPYPAPVRVHCNEIAHFNYFVLYADKDHIRQIADTVSFVTPVPTPSDCPTALPGMP